MRPARPSFAADAARFRVRALARQGWELARPALPRCVAHGFLIDALFGLALSPLAVWLLYRFLALTGRPIQLNLELGDLARSLPGIGAGVLWTALLATLILLNIGGLVRLVGAPGRPHAASVRGALLASLADLARLRPGGLLRAGLALGVLLPVGLAAGSALLGLLVSPLRRLPMPLLEAVHPAWRYAAIVLLAGVVAGAALLLARWCLVPHVFVLERRSLAASFRDSAGLPWEGRRAAKLLMAGSALGYLAVAGLVAAVAGRLNLLLLPDPGQPGRAFELWAAAVLGAQLLVTRGLFHAGLAWLVGTGAALLAAHEGWDDAPVSRETSRPGPRRRRKAWVAIACLVASSLVTLPVVGEEFARRGGEVLVIAHRGSSGRAPENTMAAVRAALEDGADLVEIDVQGAADGVPILLHDRTLARVAGIQRGAFEYTAAELAAIDVGSWMGAEFRGQGVPTLDEVLAFCQGRMGVNIELKPNGREEDLLGAVLEVVDRRGMRGQVWITSLERRHLVEARRRAPDLTLGAIVTVAAGDLWALDVELYACAPRYATPAFVAGAHRRGRGVHVWTLNEQRDVALFVDRGVDGVLTDHPALARRLIEERTPADDFRAALARVLGR